MKLDPLPPIPSPPHQHWRQFRIRVMPGIIFGMVLCVTVWLWGKNLANPLVMGQAEGPQAVVSCPAAGIVSKLTVNLYQEIKAGDVIALVETSDPQILSNTVSLIRAEMEAIRAGAGFQPRDRVRFAQFQLDWLDMRAALGTLRAELQYSEAEFERVKRLLDDGIADQSLYDIAHRDVVRLTDELEERTKAVEAAAKTAAELDPALADRTPGHVRTSLAIAEERLRLAEAELQPITLRAPIGGRITKVEVAEQSAVTRGAVIVAIAAPQVDRIVGYIPQPVRVEPELGMPIEVRSRGTHRRVAQSSIVHIGPRIELFDAPLRVRGMGAAQQRGLPIVVSVPEQMHLRPGELVDLRLITD